MEARSSHPAWMDDGHSNARACGAATDLALALIEQPRSPRPFALHDRPTATGGVALGTVGAIRGLRAKARFVRALLLPSRQFLHARTGSARSAAYFHRWAIPLDWIRGVRGPSTGGVDTSSRGRPGVIANEQEPPLRVPFDQQHRANPSREAE
jgi:hypothetical protein